jgi:putative hydrolase of the HAD superfamily
MSVKSKSRSARKAGDIVPALHKPKVYVFDLDNTLFDTRTIPRSITDPLFDALRAENHGEDAIAGDALERAFEDSWSIPFPQVAAKHGLSSRMLRRWAELHQDIRFTAPLEPFDDVVEVLTGLAGHRVLLTSGYPQVQHGKIDALGLRCFFHDILIDAADDPNRRGKQAMIAELMMCHQWQPSELLVIGDSATSEIAAGRNLGITTVQILRPRVVPTNLADYQIRTLRELVVLLGEST